MSGLLRLFYRIFAAVEFFGTKTGRILALPPLTNATYSATLISGLQPETTLNLNRKETLL